MNPLKFEPFQTTISPLFWSELVEYKLYDAKLDSSRILVRGQYECGRRRLIQSKTAETKTMALQSRFHISFIPKQERAQLPNTHQPLGEIYSKVSAEYSTHILGYLYNTNTVEEFKEIDRNSLLHKISQEVFYSKKYYNTFFTSNILNSTPNNLL
ncbi:Ubiquitin-like modifier-activating enzyme ATG7 [Smittium mucronatum]|uniref:Ubiquitin-like modifier-activating enzyme ATG7 n=1 Tax=Smittium mucronatum TaxID=133383 RepID=A0A1R0H8G8_9FUNG|nr:Ubiquitin-like modifier-activating enzyme ATG7 [Smittium mucronatum]